MQVFFTTRLVFRWANFRIESINSCLQFASALFIVSAKGVIAPAFAGVCLNQILGYDFKYSDKTKSAFQNQPVLFFISIISIL